jgi:cobalamin biosynthetic protein CobC
MDTPWQCRNREQLINRGRRLEQLLATYFTAPSTGTPLFRTQPVEGAKILFQALAKQGILVRLFTDENLLRFGLPDQEQDWRRLEQTLSTLSLIEDTSDDR